MNDRELLELAAKAAGLSWRQDVAEYRNEKGILGLWIEEPMQTRWNPLESDGDALRLAVKLCLLVYVMPDTGFTGIRLPGEHAPYAATRRAIVRAAAEIGRAMP